MELKGNQFTYTWVPNWSGSNFESTTEHSHNDMAIDKDGNFYYSFCNKPYLRKIAPSGEILETYDVGSPAIHCVAISQDSEGEWLWTVDLAGETLNKCTMDGQAVKTIGRDAFGVGEGENLKFTAVAIDPDNGNVWVSDGYGLYGGGEGGNKIYCFDKDLSLQFSFDGSESACGSLKEPHWIFADRRKGKTEIYIADRSNHRVVVYSATGEFIKVVEEGMHTPSAISSFEDYLVVSELKGRLHILDKDDKVVDTFCDGSEYSQIEGWPNRKDGDNVICPMPHIEEGKFNSPHGMIADAAGNVYVHEWLHGTRLTKLERVS